MNYKEITDLIKLINKTELAEFKLRDKDFEVSIRTSKYNKGSKAAALPAQQVISVPAAPQAAPVAAAPAPQSAPAPAANAADKEASTDNYLEIKSPIVGTFYRASSPDKPPFKKVGDRVEKGDVVCIVEAMKLFNEIESEVSGTIVKVLIEDANPVEYDQPIFLIEP